MAEHLQLLKQSLDEFALGLYRQTAEDNASKNLFLSPLSISSALLLVYLGAKDSTRKEIATALNVQKNFAGNEDAVLAAYEEVLQVFVPTNDAEGRSNFELALANRAYIQSDLKLKPEYVRDITKHLHSEIGQVNFRGDSDGARKEVNAWVGNLTHDKIKDLLAPGSVNSSTLIVLVNAVYFKADWLDKFDAESTSKQSFCNLDGKNSQVDMMFNNGKYRSFVNYDDRLSLPPFQMVELPYKNKELSMLVLLPDDKNGVVELGKKLTVDALERVSREASSQKLFVFLPKFKLEETYDLVEILQKLGVRQLFTATADLSGIAENERLNVSGAVHKAFVDVNEQGTEAAAATGMIMTLSMPIEFRADHPFIFAIRHNATGLITFIGRVAQL